jgi:2-phospho-L-lactate guanylyltransferase
MNGQVFNIETDNMPLRGHQVAKRDEGLWFLIPVKALEGAKQRLKNCLGADRDGFTVAMLKDVLAALCESNEVSQIAVVTADPRVAAIAKQGGLLVIDEIESKGMNEALELGLDTIRRMGGQRIAIIPADIPLLTGPETDHIVHELQIQRQAREDDVTGIVPSKDRGGTNFLCIETSRPFPLMFGPDSYRRHKECAIAHGSQPVSLPSPTISLDIDEDKDLDEFIAFCLSNPEYQNTETWQFLQEKGYINHAGLTRTVNGNEQASS